MNPRRYCIDTSALVHAANDSYPIDVFPSFWARLDDVIDERRILAPRQVLLELARQHDGVHKWCKQRYTLFVPEKPEYQAELTAVLKRFPSLVDERRGRGHADPWVVAVARVDGLTVITEEHSKPSAPRIPDACSALGVTVCNVLDLIRHEQWTWD